MVVLYEQRHIEQLRTHVMYVVVRSYTHWYQETREIIFLNLECTN